jgi:hypothetical protein
MVRRKWNIRRWFFDSMRRSRRWRRRRRRWLVDYVRRSRRWRRRWLVESLMRKRWWRNRWCLLIWVRWRRRRKWRSSMATLISKWGIGWMSIGGRVFIIENPPLC